MSAAEGYRVAVAGATGDRVGRRRTFQVGLAVFGLGSLLCSLAPSVGWMIAARAVQGVGGTMLNPVAMSIITNVFPPEERGRAIGVWAAIAGVALPLGSIGGGFLLGHWYWGSIFLVNLPIVVIALMIAGAALSVTSIVLAWRVVRSNVLPNLKSEI